MAANLCDCVYVRFTGRRTTATVFSEFSHESNLAGIFGNEILHNLPLVVLAIVVIWGVWKLYQTPRTDRSDEGLVWYYVKMALSLVVAALCDITAIRGGIGQTVRPITGIQHTGIHAGRRSRAILFASALPYRFDRHKEADECGYIHS